MPRTFRNFGGNIRLRPKRCLLPRSENEVLECLNKCSKPATIRVIGRLHSWNEGVVSPDVVLDLRYLNKMSLEEGPDGRVWVRAGAGCTVDRILKFLSWRGYTLPAHGIIGKQTIAGAISTGTHGAGQSSMSHYIAAVRAAAYHPRTHRATIYEWTSGDELKAARCAVGCMGVLLSVTIPCIKMYVIKERARAYSCIDEALKENSAHLRQQFYLVPYIWKWFGQERVFLREGYSPTRDFGLFQRWFKFEFLFTGIVRLLAASKFLSSFFPRFYRFAFKKDPALCIVDEAHRVLRMHDDQFTYVEMELFVPAEKARSAALYVESVLRYCGEDTDKVPREVSRHLSEDETERLKTLQGYEHHFPITFRRVLEDETLISMTGGQARFAISLVTYSRDLKTFSRVAQFLAVTMARMFDARPHWGKHCPLGVAELGELYPRLADFRKHCRSVDPHGVFRNEFVRHKIGFGFEDDAGGGAATRSSQSATPPLFSDPPGEER